VLTRGALFVLGVLCVPGVLSPSLLAHDLERTRVTLTFARDGTFVVDVANDASWLKDRMQSIPGPFVDRVVLWVDHREIRPDSIEVVHGDAATIHRMRGHVPADAQSLRWYYGLVGDPYPLTVRRADGRIIVEEIGGDASSGEIDLRGQFDRPSHWPVWLIAALLVAGVAVRVRGTWNLARSGRG
jgi:hypothetical protein